jgi:hypothetical protein
VVVGTIASVVAAIFAVWAVILQFRASRRDRPAVVVSIQVPFGHDATSGILRMGIRNNGLRPALIVEMGAEVRGHARTYPAFSATYSLPAKVEPQVQIERDLRIAQLASLIGEVPERLFVVDAERTRHFVVIEVIYREQIADALQRQASDKPA